MRVDESGEFTGRWLFDGVILTAVEHQGKDLMYAGFGEAELTGLLDQLFADAERLDAAAVALSRAHAAPAAPIQLAVAIPWLSPTAEPPRAQTANWYLDQVRSRAEAAAWRHLTLYGIYYHREDVIDSAGDPVFVTRLNAEAHRRGLRTIWVPYFDAPHAWDGADLGFDVSNVQPGYAFRSAQYGGVVNGDRLYAVAAQSVRRGQAFEYEVSTAGETGPECWAAHQYLAVAQETGADRFPQVFFVGLQGDMFDEIGTPERAVGERRRCYADLADYLAGRAVPNLELGLPSPVDDASDGARRARWTAPEPQRLWAVRMDFVDDDASAPWRGRLEVSVEGPDGTHTSFAQRTGPGPLPPHQSIQVPLVRTPEDTVSALTIALGREAGSPWPNIERMVAVQHVMPVIANGLAGEMSSTTYPVQPGPWSDDAPTHLGYAGGKLTDGRVSADGHWNWPGAMGWNFYEGQFTVTIDLGQARQIGEVELVTHCDPAAGVAWPTGTAALVGLHQPARVTGISGFSGQAVGSSGACTLAVRKVPGSSSALAGRIVMPMSAVSGRYVTVVGRGSGWVLLDEILVKDTAGAVVSTGRPYCVTPKPSVPQGEQVANGDNCDRLVDTTITPRFAPQFAHLVDGIPAGKGGSVEVTWEQPRSVRQSTIWFTEPNPDYGVIVPAHVLGHWRDEHGSWHEGGEPAPITKGLCPHAILTPPPSAHVTGVRVDLPKVPGSTGWYMVSQVTAR